MLSGIEIYKLLKNVDLKGKRIGKIWRKDFFFVFEISNFEKKFMLITKGFILFSNKAPRFPADSISQFLRKKFSGKKIENISTMGLNRIIKIEFENSDEILVFELFGRGNLLILDKEGKIKFALHKKLGRREFKINEKYEFFDAENVLESENLKDKIKDLSKKELANYLALGKLVEELYHENLDKFIENIYNFINEEINLDEFEEKYLDELIKSFVDEYKSKNSGEIEKLKKVIEELKNKREEYLKKAEKLREFANRIYAELYIWDQKLEEARKNGLKKLVVEVDE